MVGTHEAKLVAAARRDGYITTREVCDLCGLTPEHVSAQMKAAGVAHRRAGRIMMWEEEGARTWVATRPTKRAAGSPPLACSVPRCQRTAWAHGMCLMHYDRARKGTTTGQQIGSPAGCGFYGILTEEGGRIICHECGARKKSLGYHVRTLHDMTPQEYRDRYGLPRTMALVCSDLSQRHSRKSLERGAIRSVEAVRDPVAAAHARTKESMRSTAISRLRSTELRLLDQP